MTAKEIEVRLDDSAKSDCQVDPELPALYFCRDLLGYGWCFRKGDHLNIGLGRLVPQDLAEHLAQFHTMLVSREIIPPATPTHYHGHAYLLRSVSDRDPVADGVLLVGDAAGLAYPESGEGIRPAIESALLAAQIVTTAGGRYGRDDLEPYRRALEFAVWPVRGTPTRVYRETFPAARRYRGVLAGHSLVRAASGHGELVPARPPGSLESRHGARRYGGSSLHRRVRRDGPIDPVN